MAQHNKHQSLQNILKLRQQSEFVGREEHVAIFRRNFFLKPDDVERRFLFAVSGQGGAGKTWLLRHFRNIVEHSGAVTSYSDESAADLLETMEHIAAQFEQQGHPLKSFNERYKVYRQRRQELESDPEAPSGFPAFAGRTLFKVGVRLARRIPLGGALFDFVDEEALSSQAGEWTAYLTKKLLNKDEVHLMLEPIVVLTPLFLDDIYAVAEKHPVAIFFDTYEHTSEFLDVWLRDMLEGKYGNMPANIVLTIAGRDGLDRNNWAPYMSLVVRLPLEPFSEEEAREYLRRKGVTKRQVVDVILRLSGRLPLLVATLAVESPEAPEDVDDPSDTAIERFLKWIDNPTQRQVAVNAALPQHFNRDVLTVLVGEPEADALFEWLKNMPFVSEHTANWTYHQVVRGSMLRYKRRDSPQNWSALHKQLADYYDTLRADLRLAEGEQWRNAAWQNYTLQTTYHRLCQAPHQYLPPALNGFLSALGERPTFARNWADTILLSGEDTNVAETLRWGDLLVRGLNVPAKEHRKAKAQMFSALLEYSEIEPQRLPYILSQRGNIYRLRKEYDAALADFNRSVELGGESAWVLARRGETYRKVKRYDDALQDFDRAIELDADHVFAYADRASTYRDMERYDDALAGYRKAIELAPGDAFYVLELGYTYELMDDYDVALREYQRAIEVDPEYAPAVAFSGTMHQWLGHYDTALKVFTHAIELDPTYPFALNGRGLTYRYLKRYEQALADFSRAIEVRPQYHYAYKNRAVTYKMLGHYEKAVRDFNHAIDLKPDYYVAIAERGQTYLLMKRYDDALSTLTDLIKVRNRSWYLYSRSLVYSALGQADEAAGDLNQAILLAEKSVSADSRSKSEAIHLPLYYLLAGAFDKAERMYRQDISGGMRATNIQDGIENLEYVLALYPDQPQVRQMCELLQSTLKAYNC